MKKVLFTFLMMMGVVISSYAQKYAFVDMEYVMKAIPAYETANEQLNQLSKQWQKEVEAKLTEVQTMYKNYQTDLVFMSEDMKTQREDSIVAKEKDANELKRKYFGPDGELSKKREALIKPIQDEIYTAIQELCKEKGYDAIFDKSTSMNLIYSSPKLDISDDLLRKLGYQK